MKMISWNIRGTGQGGLKTQIKDLINSYKPDIIFNGDQSELKKGTINY